MSASSPIASTVSTGFGLLRRLNRFLARAAKVMVGTMLAINLAIVFAGVVFRYVFGQPLGWVYEVAIFLMMWSAFLGSAAVSQDKAHVALDFIVLKFPLRVREATQAVMVAGVIAFLIIIIAFSLTMIQGLMSSKSPYLRLPMIWVYSSVPVGMGLMLLGQIEAFIFHCITIVTGKNSNDLPA